jgi:cellulose synthase/poly-beta-1,6-N-acetylglucosamine synthase-like glycosyltransferase
MPAIEGWTEGFLVLLCVGSAGGILLVFGFYPLVVTGAGLLFRTREGPAPPAVASASLLVAVRNAEALIEEKVRNSLALVSPVPLQFVLVSDGSSDRTVERSRAAGAGRVEVLEIPDHHGKAHALNLGARRCRGEVLVLSDADALLAPDAVTRLLARFVDPRVGGVCGQRVIHEELGGLAEAQDRYIAADSALKRAESRLGSVTSNDGKLYAVRRELFRPIAPGATDDLYSCLSVVEQGRRFVFEPRARAFIRTPSRNPAHELARRRRIVSRSLRGIYLKRGLLNPWRHGFFSVQLLVNKIFRRLLPLFLVAFLGSSLALAVDHPWARTALLAQLAFYVLALAHPLIARTRIPVLGAAASSAHYFCVGNLGTLLGLMDFLRGKEAVKWDPLKAG